MGNITSCFIIKSNIDDIDGYDKPFSHIKDYELKDNIKYKTVPGPPIINSSQFIAENIVPDHHYGFD